MRRPELQPMMLRREAGGPVDPEPPLPKPVEIAGMPEIINVDQGTDAWHKCRLSCPTASNFKKLITPTGKPSTQAEVYLNLLLSELMTGEPGGPDLSDNHWVQRGSELEPEARTWYEFETGNDVEQVGFVMADGYGCSPDGLVGEDGLLEIKCPAPQTQVAYLLGGAMPGDYKAQVQGQIWVCERDWCDFCSYHPGMPPFMIRVERDEPYIKALSDRMEWFLEELERRKEKLRSEGYLPPA
jgi:hypothetical protein